MNILTPEQVAVTLQVNVETLRRWLRTGEFPASKTKAGWRITERDIEEFLAARHTGQPLNPIRIEHPVEDEDASDQAALGLSATGDFEDWQTVKARNGL